MTFAKRHQLAPPRALYCAAAILAATAPATAATPWTRATTAAGWPAREGHAAIPFNGRLWIAGGWNASGYKRDVWSTTDGLTWTQATATAAWTARFTFPGLAYNGRMWVIGGNDSASRQNDVWFSTNGVNWTRATTTAAWVGRDNFQGTVFDGRMWILGGDETAGPTHHNDVWCSTNGITWTAATTAAGWSARYTHSATTFAGRLWLLGGQDNTGYRNDVWSSTDGGSWTQATATAAWPRRQFFASTAYDGRLWIMGGYTDAGRASDVWYSTDGGNWTQDTAAAGWSARYSFPVVVYDARMWLTGGDEVNGYTDNSEVWYAPACGPATILAHPQSRTVCVGEATTLTVTADGTAPLAYQWRKDANAIAGATTNTYTLAAPALTDAGAYDCIVTNACGSATSNTANLAVSTGPTSQELQIVISQVYGGGGNAGAPYQNDFIELFNKGSTPVDITGWTIQYAATAGTGWASNVSPLSGTIQPGHYYLIQQAGGINGSLLPAADAIGTTTMGATAGKVALLRNATGLPAAICPASCHIIDLVGYGTGTNCFEGSGPTANASNTASVSRKACGFSDTNDNAADFTAGAVTPRNSSSLQGNLPVITAHPASALACVGETIVFSVTATGAAPLSYQWRKDAGAIAGATASTYTIPSAALSDIGNYDCIVTNACGAATSNAAALQISAGPTADQLQIVISQVYGGGGNPGAPYDHEFIELFNKGTTPVDITGWSVQYAAFDGAGWRTNYTPLSGVINPGHYFLIQEGFGGANGVPLPTPDNTGTVRLGATAGKIALVRNTAGLAAVNCPASCHIVDLIGYGAATDCYEGAGPAPTLSNTTSNMRKQCGLTDANNNAADFTAGPVFPRNSALPVGAPPILTVPADISTNADAGSCSITFATLPLATAVGQYESSTPAITFTRSDAMPNLLDPYAAAGSPILITWQATDACGNTATAIQSITVAAQNEIHVDIELSPTLDDPSPFDGDVLNRCVRFELWSCPAGTTPAATVDRVIAFPVDAQPHLAANVSLTVPCGLYNCITARDRLHTLRSTAPDLTIACPSPCQGNCSPPCQGGAGGVYLATFTGNRATGGHWLVGGNLNDDRFIDILDFGSFVTRFSTFYATADTTCTTPFFHTDLSGDSIVFTGDFTFIQVNFQKRHESNCCNRPGVGNDESRVMSDAATSIGGQPAIHDSSRIPHHADTEEEPNQPILSIAVSDLWRLGLGDLAAADLNRDGTLDTADMNRFAATAPPDPRPPLARSDQPKTRNDQRKRTRNDQPQKARATINPQKGLQQPLSRELGKSTRPTSP